MHLYSAFTFTFMHLADAFIQSDLQWTHSINFLSVCVFPGNRTHNLCAANEMLYHWATGTLVLLYTQSALQSFHHQCAASTWMMWRLPQDNTTGPHTSYRWRGERVIEPIKWMGIIRRPWLTRASGGNLSRTLILFTRSAVGFLMTTESQDLSLSSHPKDCAFWQYSVPVTALGC